MCNQRGGGGGFNHRITAMCLHYPVCTHKGVKQLVLSVCRSVSLSVQWKKVMYAYLIETKAVHSSAFPALFYLTLVLSTILIQSTTWIRWRPGMCWLQARVRIHQPPRSQDGEKLGRGLGTRQHIRLGTQVSEIWHVIKTRILLRGLDEVRQLFYEVHLLTASEGVAGRHKFSWKV